MAAPEAPAEAPTAGSAEACDRAVSACGAAWEIDPSQLQLREKIGIGNTATVYRGRLGPAGELVAVKHISWNKTEMGEKQQLAFDRELEILTTVAHENLVRFIGVMSLQKPFCIITEFCAGGNLFAYLHNEDGPLAWLQRYKMCIDVAKAMHYLHSHDPQIIHRDLKSLNLLLLNKVRQETDVPHLKVSDFGLSRMKDQAEWGKMTTGAGTSFWMAPEVFTKTAYDEKVDVYSYSMVLFEILCREVPFETEAASEVGRLIVGGKRPDMEGLPEDCPDLLRELMMSCWAQDPRARPAFAEVLALLAQVQLPSATGAS